MKILVTGATGFIGKYVIKELLKNPNIHIIASSSSLENLKNQYSISQVQCIPYNILENEGNINLYQYFNKPDLLIHLAWNGLPNYMKSFHLTQNLPADIQFISNLVDNGLNDITITGTCFEYGLQNGCLNETMFCEPNNYYALAKFTLFRFLDIYFKEKLVCFKWVRLFYMYGQGQNPHSLIAQLDKAIEQNLFEFNMSSGEQVRDYLSVEEVAKNIVKIATQKKVSGVINNCSGNPQKILNFVKKYLLEKKLEINLNPGFYPYSPLEPMEFWGDNQKLKKI